MKRHLKRLAAPATWNIERKRTTFIARPFPSGHAMEMCMPLTLLLTEIGSYAKTTKEVKTILHNKTILVNGRRRKDHHYPVGFLDVIEIENSEPLRIILNKRGKIAYVKISQKEAGTKVCKIVGKTMLKGKKLQVNLNDGQNYCIEGKEKCKVGDSVVVDVKNNKILDYLPFEKNAVIFLIGGKQIGNIGKVLEKDPENVTIKLASGIEYKTKKEYVFVVGKEQPVITVQSPE